MKKGEAAAKTHACGNDKLMFFLVTLCTYEHRVSKLVSIIVSFTF